MLIPREDMERLVEAKDALGNAGDKKYMDTAHYHLGSALHEVEQAESELVEAFYSSVLDFIGEHILVDGLPEDKRGTLMEWLEDTMHEMGHRIHNARQALETGIDRLDDASVALMEAVDNIERESWLAAVGAA